LFPFSPRLHVTAWQTRNSGTEDSSGTCRRGEKGNKQYTQRTDSRGELIQGKNKSTVREINREIRTLHRTKLVHANAK